MLVDLIDNNRKCKKYFNFSLPHFLTSEIHGTPFRVCPNVGELIVVLYCDLIPGRYASAFRSFACYGLCTARNNSGISTHFTIRNSLKKNSIEFRFFLHSPLLAQIVAFDTKRGRYVRGKLYYLRIKKIAKSRFSVAKYNRV